MALASLWLVALADFGLFNLVLAALGLVAALAAAALIWRPTLQRTQRPSVASIALATTIMVVGVALIAPGSESIVGPRDPGDYVATGFAIARGGSTTIHDTGLKLLTDAMEPGSINAWLYENELNHARVRFPTQLFIRDVSDGRVEGGFLPVLPVWIAFASYLGGIEAALHVAGVFGVLALIFAMFAASDARRAAQGSTSRPIWPLVGIVLATSFSQVWWAREPMGEAALGAWTWLGAWATSRSIVDQGWRWPLLAALASIGALFTRADGGLLVAALVISAVALRTPRRTLAFGVLGLGVAVFALHAVLVAPIYLSTTFGAFTFGRALGGVVAVAVAVEMVIASRRLVAGAHGDTVRRFGRWARRISTVALIAVALIAALSGLAPGVGREATLGAPSPLAWLPGYVPWPLLVLAGLGLARLGWSGASVGLAPMLLAGGLPALLYLPDPLVTGDHPWMVRRLVPAVVPLIAILGSMGVDWLWCMRSRGVRPALGGAGQFVASILVGLGLALTVASDRDLVGPRHAAGALEGLRTLAAEVPPNAVVVFPAGSAGLHLAMPLDYDLAAAEAFAVPSATINRPIAATLAAIQKAGKSVIWAQDGTQPPGLPPGVSAQRLAEARVRYLSADKGTHPPPLDFTQVDDVVTLYRLELE